MRHRNLVAALQEPQRTFLAVDAEDLAYIGIAVSEDAEELPDHLLEEANHDALRDRNVSTRVKSSSCQRLADATGSRNSARAVPLGHRTSPHSIACRSHGTAGSQTAFRN